jgi:hypothetical protein
MSCPEIKQAFSGQFSFTHMPHVHACASPIKKLRLTFGSGIFIANADGK